MCASSLVRQRFFNTKLESRAEILLLRMQHARYDMARTWCKREQNSVRIHFGKCTFKDDEKSSYARAVRNASIAAAL